MTADSTTVLTSRQARLDRSNPRVGVKLTAAILLVSLLLLSAAPGRSWGAEPQSEMPRLNVVFFTPADVEPPPGVERRLTQVADYAEKFLVQGMTKAGYEPAIKRPFTRKEDGSLEVLFVKGEKPQEGGNYDKPGFQMEVIEKAVEQYELSRARHVWWIFVYLGDPPARYSDYRGSGNSKDGGWALCNYLRASGDIELNQPLGTGFNEEFTLKACIHELGHGFGLPHWGPKTRDRRGNNLMGPRTTIYHQKVDPREKDVFLTEASAAMLWKHPIWSGSIEGRGEMPSIQVVDFNGKVNRQGKYFEISGKLESDRKAHSVIIFEDADNEDSKYWRKNFTSKINDDGTFSVRVTELDHASGNLRVLFCFDNGVVTGDGNEHGDQSGIVKAFTATKQGVELVSPGN